jgi:hypothetical protein
MSNPFSPLPAKSERDALLVGSGVRGFAAALAAA